MKISSFCNNGACVGVDSDEDGVHMGNYRVSSACNSGGSCVGVACEGNGQDVHVVAIPHTEHVITFTKDEWEAFILGAKAGEFDYPIT